MKIFSRTFSRPAALVVLAAWIALAVVMALFVKPPGGGPIEGSELYLPGSFKSQAAQQRLRELFPDQYRPSTAVVVFHRPAGEIPANAADIEVITAFVNWVSSPALWPDMPADQAARARQALHDAPIRSMITDPQLASRLSSGDSRSTLVVIGMPDIFTGQRTLETVRAIQRYLTEHGLMNRAAEAGGGLHAEITGDAGFYSDYDAAARQSVDRSTFVAIALLVIILLLVYRSPVAIVVPLVTIALAVFIGLHVLYLLAPLGFMADSVIRMFIVVIVFGTGTDYCLFIIARYKEELQASPSALAPDSAGLGGALGRAWSGVALPLVAAGLTVMAGLSLMHLAVFRAFQKAGPSVAVALAVGLLAALTLAPALYLLAGRALFWPAHPPWHVPPQSAAGGAATNRRRSPIALIAGRIWPEHVWDRIAALVTRRPALVTGAVILILAAPSIHSLAVRPTHNIFDELTSDWSCVRGFDILREGFTPGTMGPATLLVESDRPLNDERGWKLLGDLAGKLSAQPLVAEVLHPGRPLGLTGPRFSSPDETPDDILPRVEHFFLSKDGRAARLEILLNQGPYTDESVAAARDLQRIARDFAAGSGGAIKTTMLAGPSSTIADIKDVAQSDFRVVALAVLAVIYVILVALLRRPVLSVFLIFGTILSFTAALGAADWVFVNGLAQPGLDWKVKFFLLVLLVAVGVDYNIFVCARIREEGRRRPLVDAVRTALARTGGIVSACGVIVAGAFASMIAGTLSLTIQLGFALAVGILIDTFLIRPLLVPALALMLARLAERRRGGMVEK